MNLVGTPKMKIMAFSDTGFSQKTGEVEVQLNPDTYTLNYEVSYATNQATGTSGNELLFDKIQPERLNFEFLFDKTGAIPEPGLPIIGNLLSSGGGSDGGVEEALAEFREVTMGYDGTIHRTNYLILSWGTLLFKCCIQSMSVTYKLFRPDGTPLRATANCFFEEFIETDLRLREENNNSPDLTHIRTVGKGDTLPLMTYRIYGDSKYYLEVAKANNIENFRQLEVGQKIFFPPIEK